MLHNMLCSRMQHKLHQQSKGRCTQASSSRLTRKKVRVTTGTTCSAAGTTLALMIGFLPWKGCSQGGFYDTGVAGAHGDNCQAIYQPAAAAEARFAESLRSSSSGNSGSSSSSSSSSSTFKVQGLGASVSAAKVAPDLADADSSSSSGTSSGSSCSAEPDVQCTIIDLGADNSSGDASVAEQMQHVPEAAKDLVRNILHEDNRQRTKQLVDDAWQTLE